MRGDVISGVYAPRTAVSFDSIARHARAHLEKLENFINRHGYLYSAANRPTTGDFVLFELLDITEEIARAYNQPSIVTGCVCCYSWAGLPVDQAVGASPLVRA
jgi:hypothetical protein